MYTHCLNLDAGRPDTFVMMCPACFRLFRIRNLSVWGEFPANYIIPQMNRALAIDMRCPHCITDHSCESIRYGLITSQDDLEYYRDSRELERVQLVHIDNDIATAIQMLNRKGYYTKYCCSGHIDPPATEVQFARWPDIILDHEYLPSISQGYVYFEKGFKDTLEPPDGWKWDDRENDTMRQIIEPWISEDDIIDWLSKNGHPKYAQADMLRFGIPFYTRAVAKQIKEMDRNLLKWAKALPSRV